MADIMGDAGLSVAQIYQSGSCEIVQIFPFPVLNVQIYQKPIK